jgi:hypothetical protein
MLWANALFTEINGETNLLKIIDDTSRRAGVEQSIRFVDSIQVWEREFHYRTFLM